MSDLLIKCMKIPETCKMCPLSEFDARNYVIACKASGYLIDYQLAKTTRPPMICPIVEVPPHGRLIDADALIEKYGEWYTEEGTEQGFIGTIKSLIPMVPTVIEAEEET